MDKKQAEIYILQHMDEARGVIANFDKIRAELGISSAIHYILPAMTAEYFIRICYSFETFILEDELLARLDIDKGILEGNLLKGDYTSDHITTNLERSAERRARQQVLAMVNWIQGNYTP